MKNTGYIRLLLRVLAIAAVGWITLNYVFLLTQVHGNEMFPAFKDGDLVIAYRLQRQLNKNDTVVYTVNGERKTGRILGRGSDIIMMDDSGALSVNGTAQTGEILFPTYARDAVRYPYTVPDGMYFILCDYRTNGTDSRDYGAIPAKQVEGKIITILRRRGL